MKPMIVVTLALVSWLAADAATVLAQALAPTPAPPPVAGTPGIAAKAPSEPAGAKPPVAGQPSSGQFGQPAAPAPEPPAAARKHFRWVDRAGVVNYADSPPPVEYAEREGAPAAPVGTAALNAKELDKRRTALVEELLTLTLAKRSLAELNAQPPKMAPPDAKDAQIVAAVTRAMADVVNPAVTYPILRDGVLSRVDDAFLAETLTWYRMPVGRKLARLAVEAQGAQGQADLVAFAEKVRREPPPEERIALADRLDAGMGLTEAKLEMIGVTMKALAQVTESAGAPGARARMSDDVIWVMRNRLRAPTRSASLLTLLYAYRTVPDAELKSFAEFLESDAGRWYAHTSRAAAIEVMERVLDRAAERATVAGRK